MKTKHLFIENTSQHFPMLLQLQQRPFYCHCPGWPVLAIFALVCFRRFSRLYGFSLLKQHRFKSFFTHSSHDFFGRPFFLFSVISSSITSRIWELMSQRMTRPYQHRRLSLIMSSIFTRTSTLSSWSYDALPSQPHLIGNSKFAHFTIIQQNWSNTTLVNLSRLVQK